MAATDTKPRGGKPDKLIRDALMAALRQDPLHLKTLAEKWVEDAKGGDQQARASLADRIDGKAPQTIMGDIDNPIYILSTSDEQLLTEWSKNK